MIYKTCIPADVCNISTSHSMAQYKHAFTPCPVVQSIIISISAAAAATVADVVRLSLHQYRPSFTHPYSPILLNSLSLSPSIPSPDRWHEHCVYNCCPSIMHSRQESCPTKRPLSTADTHAQRSTFAITIGLLVCFMLAVLFILTVHLQ